MAQILYVREQTDNRAKVLLEEGCGPDFFRHRLRPSVARSSTIHPIWLDAAARCTPSWYLVQYHPRWLPIPSKTWCDS